MGFGKSGLVEKSFVFGLGHQKCGTTWVYAYLRNSLHFEAGVEKEYHIWDAIDIPLFAKYKAKQTLAQRLGLARKTASSIRHRMQNESGYYPNYFRRLLDAQEANITADITPSYSALSVERLEHVKRAFGERGIRILPLILVRDPIRRIKSAVRWNLDRKNYTEGINFGELDFEDGLRQYYKSEHCVMRTRYDTTIEKARKVFGADAVYVGIYETMFCAEEIERLSDFLGIEAKPEFAEKRVNTTRSSVSETSIDNDIRDYYADTYAYCHRNFPETRTLWA